MNNKLVLYVLGAIVLLVLPHFAQHFGDAWVRILCNALLYMMLALGLNIVVGYAGLLDLGYIGPLTGGVLGSHYQDIFAFIVLIIVLTLRPKGLLGERVADRA